MSSCRCVANWRERVLDLPVDLQNEIAYHCNRIDFGECMDELLRKGPKDKKSLCISEIMNIANDLYSKSIDDYNHLYNYVKNEFDGSFFDSFINALFSGSNRKELYFLEYNAKPLPRCRPCRQGWQGQGNICFCTNRQLDTVV